jgi:hypothetical protein
LLKRSQRGSPWGVPSAYGRGRINRRGSGPDCRNRCDSNCQRSTVKKRYGL